MPDILPAGENRLAKMMGSPYHPYSDARFIINEKWADDIEVSFKEEF
ncbi:MAG TPA: hypothetical protein VEH06_03475 [Candidatus Bathyarchaeia archaeon]|nr:hypothetical protein [Candidatus Bathyarchaeia archaeon]